MAGRLDPDYKEPQHVKNHNDIKTGSLVKTAAIWEKGSVQTEHLDDGNLHILLT